MALSPQETDALADVLAWLAISWAGGSPERLEQAYQVMATTPCLGRQEGEEAA